jgi:H+-transporting ATPase
MIVMLALLNDGAILSIAYDNVKYKDQPEAWNMRLVLGIATVLGLVGPVAAFGLFYLGDRVFHLDHARLQPMMYLMLSVAGHLTIFLTRTRGPFWSIRPARTLWMAVLGTQIVATLIAVYGFLMTPLGWGWAGFVWVYALIWALISDRVKLLAYRIFDPVKKAGANPETKSEPKPKVKAGAKSEAKSDEPEPKAKADPKPEDEAASKPEAKAESKPEMKAADPKPEGKDGAKPEAKAKTTSDLTPQIATRAYEIYEQQGRRDGQSVQNWDKAEQEIRKDDAKPKPEPAAKAESKPETKVAETKPEGNTGEPKAEPKPKAKAESKPEAKTEPKSETKTPESKPKDTSEPKPDANSEPKPEDKPDEPQPVVNATSKPEAKPESKPEAEAKPEDKSAPKAGASAEPRPEAKVKPSSDLTPGLVKRVHKLYEELGREDVRAVEDLEKAERESQKEEAHK